MHFGFVASLRAQWMAVRCLNSHSRFIYFWELFFRSTSESCKCQKCDKHFVEIRFIIGPKWPHSRNWLQRDDYYPQTVCPQHASNFYEPELSWSLDFGSIFILVAGRARFTATFRFKLENLLLQTVAWLFLPFLPARSTSFCGYLPCNVGSWEWAWNGFAAANVCPNWTHCLTVIQSIGQKETFFLGCLEAQPSCWLDGRVCWLVSRFICVLIWAINMVN